MNLVMGTLESATVTPKCCCCCFPHAQKQRWLFVWLFVIPGGVGDGFPVATRFRPGSRFVSRDGDANSVSMETEMDPRPQDRVNVLWCSLRALRRVSGVLPTPGQ